MFTKPPAKPSASSPAPAKPAGGGFFGAITAALPKTSTAAPAPSAPAAPVFERRMQPPAQNSQTPSRPLSPSSTAPVKVFNSTQSSGGSVSGHAVRDQDPIDEEETDHIGDIALSFAAGHTDEAIKELQAFINRRTGNVSRRTWFMLLDLYAAANMQVAFEKVAMEFAQRYSTSPPSFTPPHTASAPLATPTNSVSTATTAHEITGNELVLEGGLGLKSQEIFKSLVNLAKKTKTAKIDLTRLKIQSSDSVGMELLLLCMQELRKYKVHATLRGEMVLFRHLKNQVAKTRAEQSDTHADQTHWLLYLELLQWKGIGGDEFDDLSIAFTEHFSLSGPSFEPSQTMTIEQSTFTEPTAEESSTTSTSALTSSADGAANAGNRITLSGIVNASTVNTLISDIQNLATNREPIILDFHNVSRIEFTCSSNLVDRISTLGWPPEHIEVQGANELTLTLLNYIDAKKCMKLVPKRR